MSVPCPAFFFFEEDDHIKTLYFKYLSAAFGSALISCIYGVVDMTMVGQYQGPDGTAALVSCAAFSVFWTALSLAWSNLYIRIFMRPTAAILTMAPGIVRTYAVSVMRRATRALPSC